MKPVESLVLDTAPVVKGWEWDAAEQPEWEGVNHGHGTGSAPEQMLLTVLSSTSVCQDCRWPSDLIFLFTGSSGCSSAAMS